MVQFTELEAPQSPSLVVFSDAAARPEGKRDWRWRAWIWICDRLRPGFRHCFVLVPHKSGAWLLLEPMVSGLFVDLWPAMSQSMLVSELESRGGKVVSATPTRARAVAGFGPVTCVSAVKAHLGLSAPFVFTPWQLYRHLTTGRRAAI